jgi:hypothetical protein
MADTTMLFTTVKNPLASAKSYGYLGAHGRTLPGLGSFSQVGDLVDAIAPDTIYKSYRKSNAIQRDLLAGRIEIIKTPALILKDTVNNQIKAVTLAGGVLGVIDPSWGAYTDV